MRKSNVFNDKSLIERVQRKFLRLTSYKLSIPCTPHDYSSVLCILGLSSLADYRQEANLRFLSNLLCNQIDSLILLSYINFKVPSGTTRYSFPFHIPHLPSNFCKNVPLYCLLRSTNLTKINFVT